MKQLARKLAYVLTLAMVFGIIAPAATTVKAATPVATFDLANEQITFDGAGTFKYAVAKEVSGEANEAKDMYSIGGKVYKLTDIEEVDVTKNDVVDLAWASGKAATIAYGFGKWEAVKEIAAPDKAFKALFTGAEFGADEDVKIGSEKKKGTVVNPYLVGGESDSGYIYFVGTTSGSSVGLVDKANVEWKKGANGTWASVDTLANALPKYMAKGATLYFRLKATADAWASKEVKVAYAKQAKATAVKVDVAKDTIALKDTMEYAIVDAGDKPNADEWIDAKVHADANGRVKTVNLSDLYDTYDKEQKKGSKFDNTECMENKVIWVRLKGTAKKVVSKPYKITFKNAGRIREDVDFGTTTATAITVALTKNYSLKDGLTLTNAGTKNVEFKVIGVKTEDQAKWTTLKAAKTTNGTTKNGTAKVKGADYVKDSAVTSNAAILFRYPGVKGTTVVTLAGVTGTFNINDLEVTQQKITAATPKDSKTATVAFDAATNTVTVTPAEVSTASAIKLTVNLTATGVNEAPQFDTITSTNADVKGKIKFDKKTGSFAFDISAGKGKVKAGDADVTLTVKCKGKGNLADLKVVLKLGAKQ